MKYLVLVLLLTVCSFGSLEGKRTYGNNNIDKKVEHSQRLKENPYLLQKKKVNDPLRKEIKRNKSKVNTLLINENKYKINKKQQKSKNLLKTQKKSQKDKVLKTSKNSLSDLKREVRQNKGKSVNKPKKYIKRSQKTRKAKAYKKGK